MNYYIQGDAANADKIRAAFESKGYDTTCIAGSNLADVERDLNRALPFEEGAEYGYQYAIKKTIEFLKEKEFGDWIEQEATSFVEDFRKAMEE